jgi:hypothetical protein
MSRLLRPDSHNSPSDDPGTIQFASSTRRRRESGSGCCGSRTNRICLGIPHADDAAATVVERASAEGQLANEPARSRGRAFVATIQATYGVEDYELEPVPPREPFGIASPFGDLGIAHRLSSHRPAQRLPHALLKRRAAKRRAAES